MGEGPVSRFKDASNNVVNGGDTGLIFIQYTTDLTYTCNGVIPCVPVDIDSGNKIWKYFVAASSPKAKIEPARTITGKETLAPKVASFSSRGPSPYYADIIKPDIAAPGANILAAIENSYGFMSGTSMAAPHVSGIVALLKALHPNWSPAALKSDIVTTASVTDEHDMPLLAEGLPRKIADPFDYGGGHIDPNRAADPGLIYDIDPRDYNYFFGCIITKTSANCNGTSVPPYHLNLPSISAANLRHPVTISRTVYHAAIQGPPGVKMDVQPSILVYVSGEVVTSVEVTRGLYIWQPYLAQRAKDSADSNCSLDPDS